MVPFADVGCVYPSIHALSMAKSVQESSSKPRVPARMPAKPIHLRVRSKRYDQASELQRFCRGFNFVSTHSADDAV